MKNISLSTSGKSMALLPPSRPTRGAFRDRHDALGRNVMDALASGVFLRRTKTPKRTAKSCGPGAAMLALSLWSNSQVTVAKKPAHRGEHEVSRKPIARGKPGCFG